MDINIDFLANHEEAIPLIARWYHTEWGHTAPGRTVESTAERLRGNLNRDRIPFNLVAILNDEVVATAELKYREMAEMFPDNEHWLGGVYTAADHRGRGYAARVIGEIAALARGLDVDTLWLQTERLDGGLYSKLGWQPWRQVNNHGIEVLVMERSIER